MNGICRIYRIIFGDYVSILDDEIPIFILILSILQIPFILSKCEPRPRSEIGGRTRETRKYDGSTKRAV